MKQAKRELVMLWSNHEKRRGFLKNYKEWGVWLTVPELRQKYYRFDRPGDSRILVMEYQRKNPYATSDERQIMTIVVNYLWDGEFLSQVLPASMKLLSG